MHLLNIILISWINISLIRAGNETESEITPTESDKSDVIVAEEKSDNIEDVSYDEYEYLDDGSSENAISERSDSVKGNTSESPGSLSDGFPTEVFLTMRNITADAATAFRSFTNRNDIVDLQASASDNLNVTNNDTSEGVNLRALRDAGPFTDIGDQAQLGVYLPYKHAKVDTADLSDCALQGEWKPMGVAHGHLHQQISVAGDGSHPAEILQSVGSYSVPSKVIPQWGQNSLGGGGGGGGQDGHNHKPSYPPGLGTNGGFGSGSGYGGNGHSAENFPPLNHQYASGAVSYGGGGGGFSGQFQKMKTGSMLSPPPLPPIIFGKKPGYWKSPKTKLKFHHDKKKRPVGFPGFGGVGYSSHVSHGVGGGSAGSLGHGGGSGSHGISLGGYGGFGKYGHGYGGGALSGHGGSSNGPGNLVGSYSAYMGYGSGGGRPYAGSYFQGAGSGHSFNSFSGSSIKGAINGHSSLKPFGSGSFGYGSGSGFANHQLNSGHSSFSGSFGHSSGGGGGGGGSGHSSGGHSSFLGHGSGGGGGGGSGHSGGGHSSFLGHGPGGGGGGGGSGHSGGGHSSFLGHGSVGGGSGQSSGGQQLFSGLVSDDEGEALVGSEHGHSSLLGQGSGVEGNVHSDGGHSSLSGYESNEGGAAGSGHSGFRQPSFSGYGSGEEEGTEGGQSSGEHSSLSNAFGHLSNGGIIGNGQTNVGHSSFSGTLNPGSGEEGVGNGHIKVEQASFAGSDHSPGGIYSSHGLTNVLTYGKPVVGHLISAPSVLPSSSNEVFAGNGNLAEVLVSTSSHGGGNLNQGLNGGLIMGHLIAGNENHGMASGGGDSIPEAAFLSNQTPGGEHSLLDSVYSSSHISKGIGSANSHQGGAFLSSHVNQDFGILGQGISGDSSSSSTFTCGKNHDHNTNYHTATFQVADHDHPSSVDVLQYQGDAAVLIKASDVPFNDQILPERKHYKTWEEKGDSETSGSNTRNELSSEAARLSSKPVEQETGHTEIDETQVGNDGDEPERHTYYREITKVTKIPATSVGSVKYTYSEYETKPQSFSQVSHSETNSEEPEVEHPQILRELEQLSNKFQLDLENPKKHFENPPSEELSYQYPFHGVDHSERPGHSFESPEKFHEGPRDPVTEFPQYNKFTSSRPLDFPLVFNKKPQVKYIPRPVKPQLYQKTPKHPPFVIRKHKPTQYQKNSNKQKYEVEEHSGERQRPVNEIFPPQKFPKQFHNPKPNFAVDRPKNGWPPATEGIFQDIKYDYSRGKKVKKVKSKKQKIVAPILVRRPVTAKIPPAVIRVVQVSG